MSKSVLSSAATLVAGFLAIVAFMSPAGAQTSFDVSVEATSPAIGQLTVSATGLDDFVGGRLVVYVCGNADADFVPITPTEQDCIGPGGTGYRSVPIDEPTVEIRYTLRTNFLGSNDARCIATFADNPPCNLVVAAVSDDGTEITGVPLDDVLADIAAAGVEPDELAATGLSNTASAVLLFVAAAVIYLGYLLWSATRTPVDADLVVVTEADIRR